MILPRISLLKTIVLTTVIVSSTSFILLVMSANSYRQLVFDNEQAALAEMISIKVADIITDLKRVSIELGSTLQSSKSMRQAFRDDDKLKIKQLLNNQFFQYFTTAGILKIKIFYVFDEEFNLISASDEGYIQKSTKPLICSKLIDKASSRKGPNRLKYLSQLCSADGMSYFGVIVPIGGLIQVGYIAVITDPINSLKPLEAALGNPIQIRYPRGDIVYQSKTWPRSNEMDRYIVAENNTRSVDGTLIFCVEVARDIGSFLLKLNNTAFKIISLAGFIIVLAFVATICFLRRAFAPVKQLQIASERLTNGEHIPVSMTSYPEIDGAVGAFNNMASEMTELISRLESEIQRRKDIEIQLYEHQGELEKSRDEALEANKFKSEFLANMSHEIRTPLTAIIGFAESTLDINQTMPERIEAINTIIGSGNHLLQIINDILDLSKIEADKLDTESVELSLFEVISDVESIINMQAEKKGLELKVIFDFPLPEKIFNDSLRLKQVILNLCSNAIKFTDHGYVHINVCWLQSEKQLIIEICDTGIGLKTSQLDNIFDAFIQADSSITRNYGGTGLGLSLTKKLVEKMGGNISVTSTYGSGSRFKISIATGDTTDVTIIRNPSEIPAPKLLNLPGQKKQKLQGRILLAEDNKNNQRLLTVFLKRFGEGIHVEIAENGKEAVLKAMQGEFDLLFMDMQMPIMGGVEATKLLREKGYKNPIVALTANAMEEDKKACVEAGCNGFVTKPVNRDKLYQETALYLRHQEYNEESPIYAKLDGEKLQLIEKVKSYIINIRKNLPDVKRTYKNNEYDAFDYAIRQLKDSGILMGFPIVSTLAAKIEFHNENNDSEAVYALLSKLEQTVDRLRVPTAGEDVNNDQMDSIDSSAKIFRFSKF